MEGGIKCCSNGQFHVIGPMDFTTVNQLLMQSEKLFANAEQVILDLQAVSNANSAGLALLLEWYDRLQRQHKLFKVYNIPNSLLDIARISNCIEILKLIT